MSASGRKRKEEDARLVSAQNLHDLRCCCCCCSSLESGCSSNSSKLEAFYGTASPLDVSYNRRRTFKVSQVVSNTWHNVIRGVLTS